MLSDARIRGILTKPVSDIKLRKLIEEKRILIVKVAKGSTRSKRQPARQLARYRH